MSLAVKINPTNPKQTKEVEAEVLGAELGFMRMITDIATGKDPIKAVTGALVGAVIGAALADELHDIRKSLCDQAFKEEKKV